MLGILNFAATPKVTPGAPGAEADKTAGQTLALAGEAGQGTLGSFAALLAQAVAGEGETAKGPAGGLTRLAAMLGKFRAEAQESLAEVFPDGVIVPGPQFNDWARAMLGKLDGMLQEAGMSLSDLGQVLGSLGDALGGAAEEGGLLTAAAQTLLGDAGIDLTQAGPAGVDLAGSVDLSLPADPRAPLAGAPTVTEGAEAAATVLTAEAGKNATAQAVDQPEAAPLPDALRILLAQVVAAPADQRLPPDVQSLISAPQPAAAPLISTVAATAPVQAPQQPQPAPSNGFARNLAGQIRGVSFNEGTTRIELTPQGLGKLEIEIAPDEAGKLRVVIRAENPSVLHAMRNDREMLAGILRDGGTSVDDAAMSFEDLGQRHNSAGRDEAMGGIATSSATSEDEDEAPAMIAQAGDGRLNILT
ncbi:MAG: hypothetical protein CL583_15950 [Alteromonadaceae bacterium]|nr:hypothetical protein [Alteromonadaceae bacterium]